MNNLHIHAALIPNRQTQQYVTEIGSHERFTHLPIRFSIGRKEIYDSLNLKILLSN